MQNNSDYIITDKVVLCNANLFQPWSIDEQTSPEFSTMVIIPKNDVETINKINTAVETAISRGESSLFKDGITDHSSIVTPLKDGDIESCNSHCKDSVYFTASSTIQPKVVNKNKDLTLIWANVNDGTSARVTLSFHPYREG